MAVDVLLARLDKVHELGPSKWGARCPSHDDSVPSLGIRELGDGRILIHCFAGCGASEVMQAVGLELADLMPVPTEHFERPTKRAFTESDALRLLVTEARVVALVASDIVEGKHISPADADRVALAAGRIADALEKTFGNR